jgi:hypothetical protein
VVTGGPVTEPTLDDVQREFPDWRCEQGINRLYYARHTPTGAQVRGEDPMDLRDQIRAAEARYGLGPWQPGAAGES